MLAINCTRQIVCFPHGCAMALLLEVHAACAPRMISRHAAAGA
jgi:hypothetical protein